MNRIIIVVLIAIAMFNEVQGQQDTTANTKVGDKAPSFTCKTLDGKNYDLSQLRGKIVMINFFATWCPGCNLELPELERVIWKKYRTDPGFVLLVIGREHTEKDLRDYAGLKHLDLPFAADPGRDIYKLYASKYIPRNIVIDKTGVIIYQNSGFKAKDLLDIDHLISAGLKK